MRSSGLSQRANSNMRFRENDHILSGHSSRYVTCNFVWENEKRRRKIGDPSENLNSYLYN